MGKVEFYETRLRDEDPHDACDQGRREYRWRLRAANGEIVASGEAYTQPRDAQRGFEDFLRVVRPYVVEQVRMEGEVT